MCKGCVYLVNRSILTLDINFFSFQLKKCSDKMIGRNKRGLNSDTLSVFYLWIMHLTDFHTMQNAWFYWIWTPNSNHYIWILSIFLSSQVKGFAKFIFENDIFYWTIELKILLNLNESIPVDETICTRNSNPFWYDGTHRILVFFLLFFCVCEF